MYFSFKFFDFGAAICFFAASRAWCILFLYPISPPFFKGSRTSTPQVDFFSVQIFLQRLVCCSCLKVEFLLKTDSGYPKDAGVNTKYETLGIIFNITTLGQFYQCPPSPIPGDRARGKRRCFSPGDAARHSKSAAPTVGSIRNFVGNTLLFDFSGCSTGRGPSHNGRGPSHQSSVLKHRDTYGQAQVCREGHQGSSRCAPIAFSRVPYKSFD